MRLRTILLMVAAIGLTSVLSGCSAIGFVGGTIIDNALTEEKPLPVPTAGQLRDSVVATETGERIIVEKTSGQQHEGIYARTRVVTVQVEREKVSAVLESGLAALVPQSSNHLESPALTMAAGRPMVIGGGPKFVDATAPGIDPETESRLVTLRADALLVLGDTGPVMIPVYGISGISVLRSKNTTMRLVILGAITDFMLLQGALGLLITSS